MTHKQLRKNLKQCTAQKKANKELYLHYKELFQSGTSELKFKNMIIESLLNALYEVQAVTNDDMIKKVIDNYIERYNLDLLVHARKISPNPDRLCDIDK